MSNLISAEEEMDVRLLGPNEEEDEDWDDIKKIIRV